LDEFEKGVFVNGTNSFNGELRGETSIEGIFETLLYLDMGVVPNILIFFLLMQGENIDSCWEVRSFYLIGIFRWSRALLCLLDWRILS
jgi:hypothetical protein